MIVLVSGVSSFDLARAQVVDVDTLFAPNPTPTNAFGIHLSSIVDTGEVLRLLVTDTGVGDRGAVFTFFYDNELEHWTTGQILGNEAPDSGRVFGTAVTLDTNTLPLIAVSDAGWVTLWRFDGIQWFVETSVRGITKPGTTQPSFGSGLAITILESDEELVFVGAENGGDTDPGPGSREGSAYAFVRSSETMEWTREVRLLAPSPLEGEEFGASVAVVPLAGGHAGDALALVGAPRRPFNTTQEGRALAYTRDGATGTWSLETELIYPDGDLDVGEFGTEVDLLPVPGGEAGEVIAVVGAPFANVCGVVNTGVAYAFHRSPEGVWELEDRLCSAEGRVDYRFGSAIAIDAYPVQQLSGVGPVRVLVGTEPSATPPNGHPGGADLYERTVDEFGEVSWTRHAHFASGAAGTGPSDFYGSAVALAGDLALVGARSSDLAAENAGAVFVYGPTTVSNEQPEPTRPGLEVQVQPNPSLGHSQVVVRMDRTEDVRIDVIDALGRVVQRTHRGLLAAGEHRFSISGLVAGVYSLRVSRTARVTSTTFTVVR